LDLDQAKKDLQEIFEQLHKGQKEKAALLARKHNPQLTTEDLLNPDNFPALINDPNFMYEDGIAAGILSAQIAVRAYLNSLMNL
jgi:hypothetical protein